MVVTTQSGGGSLANPLATARSKPGNFLSDRSLKVFLYLTVKLETSSYRVTRKMVMITYRKMESNRRDLSQKLWSIYAGLFGPHKFNGQGKNSELGDILIRNCVQVSTKKSWKARGALPPEPSLRSGSRYTIEPASYAYSSRPIFLWGRTPSQLHCSIWGVRGTLTTIGFAFNIQTGVRRL